MTAKEYLIQIRMMDNEIQALRDLVEEHRTKLTRISPVLSDMPKASGNTDKIGDGLSAIYDIYKKMTAKINAIEDEKEIVYEIIESIDDNTLRVILYKRYFAYMTFEEISVSLNYSYRHICRLHGEALQKFTNSKRWQDMSYKDMK